MAQGSEVSGPVVGSCADFHADQTGRPASKELDELLPPDLLANGNPALGINGMDLKTPIWRGPGRPL